MTDPGTRVKLPVIHADGYTDINVLLDLYGGSVKKTKAIWLMCAVFAAAPMLGLASCSMAGLTGIESDLDESASAKASQALTSKKSLAPEKIVGTAVTGSTCVFFEFDVKSSRKTVRVLVPASTDGYIQDGAMTYKEVIYDLPTFYANYEYGLMAGTTGEKDGVHYTFQGNYSPSDGFVGEIAKIDNGTISRGYLVGTPIFQGTKAINYVGAATYLFDTPTPQTLLFNATANFDTNEVAGTWCESGVGWNYGIHGTIGGTLNADGTIGLNAAPLPAFNDFLLYPLNVVGEGTFLDPARKTVSGYLNLLYGEYVLPSTIVAVREKN